MPSAPNTFVTRLRPPNGISESTRWLFWALGVVSVLLTLLPVLAVPHLGVVLLALASAVVLIGSWTHGYVSRSVRVWSDIADALALCGLAAASPQPTAALAVTFAAVWYRALYGSTQRSLVRCGLYMTALAGSLTLWPRLTGHLVAAPAGSLYAAFPFLIVTLLVGRQLGLGLAAREASLGRNTVLAATGAELLGMTDRTAIRDAGRRALTGLCAATPGLCIIAIVDEGPHLRIESIVGAPVATGSTALPTGVFDPADPARIRDSAPLNAAVGAQLRWTGLVFQHAGVQRRLVIGAKRMPHDDVTLAMRSVCNQIMLALSNSDVHQDLSIQARVDALTGLVNRAAFTAELTTRSSRDGSTPAQVLFVDLDDFKLVNDEMGHQSGDLVLAEVARRIQGCSRPDDVCARLGGDEFAILLPGASARDAQRIAQRMVERIAEPIEVGGGRLARVGASIGISSTDADTEIATVVSRADVAMYAAKARGKGRLQVFSAGLLDIDPSRSDIDKQVAGAVAAGEIVVHYQPILTVAQRTCVAVEALVRWRHPDRGLLEPANFLHIAERSGAMIDIGAFVLRQACRDVVLLARAHPDVALSLHVNISAGELEHKAFVELVCASLTESGLPAAQLVLELGDGIALNSVTVMSRIDTLTELGVRIAIDVGTDQFPLSALRTLPISVIKLDQSFLDGAGAGGVDRAVAEAVVRMAAQLGMQTVAVRTERVEQQTFLEQLGIDAVQGYLHMRPVPAAHLDEWLGSLLGRPGAYSGTALTSRLTA